MCSRYFQFCLGLFLAVYKVLAAFRAIVVSKHSVLRTRFVSHINESKLMACRYFQFGSGLFYAVYKVLATFRAPVVSEHSVRRTRFAYLRYAVKRVRADRYRARLFIADINAAIVGVIGNKVVRRFLFTRKSYGDRVLTVGMRYAYLRYLSVFFKRTDNGDYLVAVI